MDRATQNSALDTAAAAEPCGLRRSARIRKAVDYSENKKVTFDDVAPEPPRKKAKTTRKPKVRAESVRVVTPAQLDEDKAVEPPLQFQKPEKTRPRYENENGEKLKKPYQEEPPEHFEKKKERALSQPIAILSRDRSGGLREVFEISGSAGTPYLVTIQSAPKCTCSDFTFRRQSCKHIIYVLHYALKVPEDSELLYQYAFSDEELGELLSEETAARSSLTEDLYKDSQRKTIDGDCGICYMAFEPGKERKRIDYCRACGNNVHDKCIKIWIQSQRASYGKATCPYCRNDWQ